MYEKLLERAIERRDEYAQRAQVAADKGDAIEERYCIAYCHHWNGYIDALNDVRRAQDGNA